MGLTICVTEESVLEGYDDELTTLESSTEETSNILGCGRRVSACQTENWE